jgi:hypothetical protein
MQKIKAIVKRPDEMYGHMTWISNSLKNLQNTVDGYIETVTVASDMVIICNEEGLINWLPFNCAVGGHLLHGDIVVVGTDGEDFTDIPIDFKTWRTVWLGGAK